MACWLAARSVRDRLGWSCGEHTRHLGFNLVSLTSFQPRYALCELLNASDDCRWRLGGGLWQSAFSMVVQNFFPSQNLPIPFRALPFSFWAKVFRLQCKASFLRKSLSKLRRDIIHIIELFQTFKSHEFLLRNQIVICANRRCR